MDKKYTCYKTALLQLILNLSQRRIDLGLVFDKRTMHNKKKKYVPIRQDTRF